MQFGGEKVLHSEQLLPVVFFLTRIGYGCCWSLLSWHVLIMSENVEYKTVGAYIGLQRKARLLLGHPLLIRHCLEF